MEKNTVSLLVWPDVHLLTCDRPDFTTRQMCARPEDEGRESAGHRMFSATLVHFQKTAAKAWGYVCSFFFFFSAWTPHLQECEVPREAKSCLDLRDTQASLNSSGGKNNREELSLLCVECFVALCFSYEKEREFAGLQKCVITAARKSWKRGKSGNEVLTNLVP